MVCGHRLLFSEYVKLLIRALKVTESLNVAKYLNWVLFKYE